MFVTRHIRRSLSRLLPRTRGGDRVYATIDFWARHRRPPRFRRPVSFSDHLIGLRAGVRDADALRRTVADKVEVKEYIGRVAGPRYAVETVDVLCTEADVTSFSPPIPCIFKAAHMSGYVLLVTESESELDRDVVKDWLLADYYWTHREWFYRDLAKRVLVERLLSDDGRTPPDDFKVYCFQGMPKFIQVDCGRFTEHTRTLYTSDWNRLPAAYRYPAGADIPVPGFLEEMLRVAALLAAPFAFIRVDFLATKEGLKVNELTNCPEAARGRWTPRAADRALGGLFANPGSDVLELLGT